MMRTVLITGAASGIGRATAAWLQRAGHRVIGVDLRGADIETDLGTAGGRATLVSSAAKLAPEGLDSVVACAGVASAPAEQIVSVNYFGAVATLEGLLPLLRKRPRPRAVVVASSAALLPADAAVLDACLASDEPLARKLATPLGQAAYMPSKQAIARWMRRTAIEPRWAGSGVALNGVAPGLIRTPMTAGILATEEGRAVLAKSTPTATHNCGEPNDPAELLAFLATMETDYLIGQLIFIDGGTDVLLRPDAL